MHGLALYSLGAYMERDKVTPTQFSRFVRLAELRYYMAKIEFV